MPHVNPAILRWARNAAGLTEADAAHKIGLNPAYGLDGAQRLRALEAGDQPPSRTVLSKMAAVYRRPLLSFYLDAPPTVGEQVEDFRALPDRRPESEPLVQALVRDVRARQQLVRGFLEDEEAEPLPFIGSAQMANGVDQLAVAISRRLGFQLDLFRGAGSPEAAFAYLRERAESAGVFVLLIGDLGSHHTELDTEAFRGFALSDPIAPFVVINDRDSRSAWSFTLLHELAHLWLGVSGVSGAHAETRVERLCNDVASRVLLPLAESQALVLRPWNDIDQLAESIAALAAPRRLSRTLVALRLYQAGHLTEEQWEAARAWFRDAWRRERARRREERPPGGGGPNAHVVRRHHLGSALVLLVARAMSEGALTPTKAGKVLGVRPRNVDVLLRGRAA